MLVNFSKEGLHIKYDGTVMKTNLHVPSTLRFYDKCFSILYFYFKNVETIKFSFSYLSDFPGIFYSTIVFLALKGAKELFVFFIPQ